MESATIERHTTARGQQRLLVRFPFKPGGATMKILRTFGRYRKGARCELPGWYLACDEDALRSAAALVGCHSLLNAIDAMGTHPKRRRLDCAACAWEDCHKVNAVSPHAHTMSENCWFK